MLSEYRYTLTRDLGVGRDEALVWVMLNPSTADETVDDPTIRRVKAFTAREGYRRLEVVNLFALRATKPEMMLSHPDPGGPGNVDALDAAFVRAGAVVFAWGSWAPKAARGTIAHKRHGVTSLARLHGHTPLCLGVTADGSPRHPLYVRSDRQLVPLIDVGAVS